MEYYGYSDTLEEAIKKYKGRNEYAFILGGVRVYHKLINTVGRQERTSDGTHELTPEEIVVNVVANELGAMERIFRNSPIEARYNSIWELTNYDDINPEIPLGIAELYYPEIYYDSDQRRILERLEEEFEYMIKQGLGEDEEYDIKLYQSFFKYTVSIARAVLNKPKMTHREIGEKAISAIDRNGHAKRRREVNMQNFMDSFGKLQKTTITESPFEIDTPQVTGLLDE